MKPASPAPDTKDARSYLDDVKKEKMYYILVLVMNDRLLHTYIL